MDHIFVHSEKAKREQDVGRAYTLPKPIPTMCFLQQSSTSANNTTNWDQVSKSMSLLLCLPCYGPSSQTGNWSHLSSVSVLPMASLPTSLEIAGKSSHFCDTLSEVHQFCLVLLSS